MPFVGEQAKANQRMVLAIDVLVFAQDTFLRESESFMKGDGR